MDVGIFVEIKNNKLFRFIPFNNMNYENKWHNNIKLNKKYKSTKQYFDIKNRIYLINNNLFFFV